MARGNALGVLVRRLCYRTHRKRSLQREEQDHSRDTAQHQATATKLFNILAHNGREEEQP